MPVAQELSLGLSPRKTNASDTGTSARGDAFEQDRDRAHATSVDYFGIQEASPLSAEKSSLSSFTVDATFLHNFLNSYKKEFHSLA